MKYRLDISTPTELIVKLVEASDPDDACRRGYAGEGTVVSVNPKPPEPTLISAHELVGA